MHEQQLLLLRIPKDHKKTAYNIAHKAGVKISIHTRGDTAFILLVVSRSVLDCNLLNLPEPLHGVYRFFDELRKRQFEYSLDVYSHDYKETQRRNEVGVFDLKQLTLC